MNTRIRKCLFGAKAIQKQTFLEQIDSIVDMLNFLGFKTTLGLSFLDWVLDHNFFLLCGCPTIMTIATIYIGGQISEGNVRTTYYF